MTAATSDYLDSQDLVGQWLTECCVVEKAAETLSSKLFASWKEFAETSNERPGTQKALSESCRPSSRESTPESERSFMACACGFSARCDGCDGLPVIDRTRARNVDMGDTHHTRHRVGFEAGFKAGSPEHFSSGVLLSHVSSIVHLASSST